MIPGLEHLRRQQMGARVTDDQMMIRPIVLPIVVVVFMLILVTFIHQV